jgi:glucose/arabinose dehydrogenase
VVTALRGFAFSCTLSLAATLAACGGGGGDDEGAATTSGTLPTGGGSGPVKLVEIGEFDQPLYVTQPAGSDRLYVVEKTGRVRVVREGQVMSEPFLDLSDAVSYTGEQGLLSIAFAPDFERSRLFYAYYTNRRGDQRISEFEAPTDEHADPGSERQVLLMEDFASNHNGGLLLFGPDGLLYVGTGDGGLAADQRNGQDLGSLLGKILRIDPRASNGRPYTVPDDNPFTERPEARPEIYVYGLRNPWRFSFDRDDLVIADVGQSAFEEVDYLPAGGIAGANLGWPAYEGDARFNSDQRAPGHVRPILTYPTEQGCSITGGYVVRNRALPALYGRYLYGDYCSGELRSLIATPRGARDDTSLGLQVPALSSFGQDADGRVYATSLDGPVFRLSG